MDPSGALGVTLTGALRNLLALDSSMQVEVDRRNHLGYGVGTGYGRSEGLLSRILQHALASAFAQNSMADFWGESPQVMRGLRRWSETNGCLLTSECTNH